MNRVFPKKLLNSKWTAVVPRHKDKHFIITEVEFDENGVVIHCLIEALRSKKTVPIDWRSLKNSDDWKQGWK